MAIKRTLGYIRHEINNNQLQYYAGTEAEHCYDFPVNTNTTLGNLTTLLGQHGPAFIFFAKLLQEQRESQ